MSVAEKSTLSRSLGGLWNRPLRGMSLTPASRDVVSCARFAGRRLAQRFAPCFTISLSLLFLSHVTDHRLLPSTCITKRSSPTTIGEHCGLMQVEPTMANPIRRLNDMAACWGQPLVRTYAITWLDCVVRASNLHFVELKFCEDHSFQRASGV